MIKQAIFSIVVVATGLLFNSAKAESVYRCGDTYSQSLCPGGKVLDVSDSRDAAQKQQADEATIRDTELARSMAQERLAQEKNAKLAQAAKASSHRKNQARAATVSTKKTPKQTRSKSKKPVDFTAEVPGSKKATGQKNPASSS
jgi:hypothetical protein